MEKIYDVLILGGGPAGLSAALYAGRACLSALIVEKGTDGGQIAISGSIENYPGQLAEGESGPSLVSRMSAQAARFGAERVSDTISSVELEGEVKRLTGSKGTYLGRTVIVAAGARPRPIGCENEEKYVGMGISFCATCDGPFFRGLEVYVAGGGDSAVEEALYLTRFARKVTVIHRRDKLRASKLLQERAFAEPKMGFLWDSVVKRVDGDGALSAITVENVETGAQTVLRADEKDGMLGLFGFIGYEPNTKLFEGALPLEHGYIRTDEDMRTSIPGVFAAGDIRVKDVRQVVTATADGAIAAIQAGRYLER